MNARRFLLPGLLMYAALHGMSYGQAVKLIGVNFMGRQANNNDGPTMGLTETAGVNLAGSGGPNLIQQNWNNVETDHPWDGFIPNTVGSSSGTPANGGNDAAEYTTNVLRDSNGNLTPVTLTITNANDQWNTPSLDHAGQVNDGNLFYGIYKRQGVGTAINFTLNNLNDFAVTGTLYEVIVYYAVNGVNNDDGSAGGRKMDLFVTGDDGAGGTALQSRYVREQQLNTVTFAGYTQGVSTNPLARDSFGSNFTRFTNLKAYDLDGAGPNSTFGLKIDAMNQATADGIGIAGIQLLSLTPFGAPKIWTGNNGNSWDVGVTANWDFGGATTFANDDSVQFDDSGAVKNVDVEAGGVTIGLMTVDNSDAGGAYVISGGSIGGDGVLLKKNTGTLTLLGENTFTGVAELQNGVVNVPAIGDSSAGGPLGSGTTLILGAAGTSVTLNYTGAINETVARSLVVAGGGGTVNIPAGVELSFTGGLSGGGDLVKAGAGDLIVTGASTATGNLTVAQGILEVGALGSGVGKTVTLGGAIEGGALRYSGGNLNDARGLTVSAGGGVIEVTNATAQWKLNGPVNVGDNLFDKAGAGRLVLAGEAIFNVMPTITGGVLAITNPNSTLPTAIAVPSGTLELAPGTYLVGTEFGLQGGTIRVGHEGLVGNYYSGGFNQADWQTAMGRPYYGVNAAFTEVGVPAHEAPTTTGGQTDLNFPANNGGNQTDQAPFANQGFAVADEVRVQFLGKILIPTPGLYTFYTGSDDGSAVFLNDTRVVNNNFYQGHTVRGGSINLTAGVHDIMMYYYEAFGGASMAAEWEGPGIPRQFIPNSVLFGGAALDATSSALDVATSSTLEVMHQIAHFGPLTQAGGTTLSIAGSATFTGTDFGAGGTPTVNVTLPLGNVDLGSINTPFTLDKTGPGALVFSQPAPTGSAINVNSGLVVVAGSEDAGLTVDPLAGSVLNFNGGGLGLSATAGNPIYTRDLTSTVNWRVEAGRFHAGVASPTTAAIQYNPDSGNLTAAAGQTGSFRVRESNYTLNVGASVGGEGSVVAEEGIIQFQGATFEPAGGFTVRLANATVSGPINSGPIAVTGAFNGVTATGTMGTLNANNTVVAPSIAVSGGTLNTNGLVTLTGNLTVSGGTANLNAGATVGGILETSGGTTNVGGTNNVFGSIAHNGGNLNISASTTVTNGTMIAAAQALHFNGFGTVNFASSITSEQALIRSSSGVTDLGDNGILFQAFSFAEGLQEGHAPVVDNNLNNPANRGIVDRPRMGETSAQPPWGFNETWVYSGQFFDADGIFAFAESIDDNVRVVIDGVTVLANDQWNVATSTGNTEGQNLQDGTIAGNANASAKTDGGTFAHNYGMGPDGDGWHNIKILFSHGGGGSGPYGGDGTFGWAGGDNATFNNKGFGLNSNPLAGSPTSVNGNDYIIPVEVMDGTPQLFRVPVGGGEVRVENGSAIRAGRLDNAAQIVLTGGGSTFALNNAAFETNNSTYRIESSGSSGTLDIGANQWLDTQVLTVSAFNGTVVKAGSGLLRIAERISAQPNTTFEVQNGFVLFDAQNIPPAGNMTTTVSSNGAIGGNGKLPGALSVAIGGTIVPGTPFVNNGIAELTIPGSLSANGAILGLELRTLGPDPANPDYDRLRVIGDVDISATELSLQLAAGFSAPAGSLFFIVINDGENPIFSNFSNLAQGDFFVADGAEFSISYEADFDGGTFSGGNDIAIQYVPEPGTAMMLLGGLGALLGCRRSRRRA